MFPSHRSYLGVLSALPWIATAVCTLLAGMWADWLLNERKWSFVKVRASSPSHRPSGQPGCPSVCQPPTKSVQLDLDPRGPWLSRRVLTVAGEALDDDHCDSWAGGMLSGPGNVPRVRARTFPLDARVAVWVVCRGPLKCGGRTGEHAGGPWCRRC
jgi:hypothetical protein